MTENPWIECDGGRMPVAAETLVEVRFRDETTDTADRLGNALPAKQWSWGHYGEPTDIIAYRVVKP